MNAIEAWKESLGDEKVSCDPETLDRYGRTTISRGHRPVAVLFPDRLEDVLAIVRISNEYKAGLYPISRGLNWGYGSASPVVEGQAVVDFSRMNRIIEVNENLAYAVIEPGVTQQQLHDYLKKKKCGLWLDCTGSGPDASILGNTLEKGFGHTPYGDHFLNSCGMEVVLGDGRVLNTGYGHYTNAKAAYTYKYAIGPFLEGIFTQSNFGIVTKLGIWLMPEPECVNAFFVNIRKDADLSRVIDALRPLKMEGLIQSLCHIGNDLRVISSFRQYPWKLAEGITPLPEQARRQIREKGKFGAWNVSGAIYGSKEQVRFSRRKLAKTMRRFGKVQFFDANKVRLAGRIGDVLEYFGLLDELVARIRSFEKVFRLMKGEPTDVFMFGTLWRVKDLKRRTVRIFPPFLKDILKPRTVKAPATLNPLDNSAGVMWVSPILPLEGCHASRLMEIINPIYEKHGFEPLITFSLLTDHAMVSVVTICFDKSDPEETSRAEACYNDFFISVMDAGYVPYRTSIYSMDKLDRGSSVFWDVVDEIKGVLDPNRIISKGRYNPVELKRKDH